MTSAHALALRGDAVRLDPLGEDDAEPLFEAAQEDRWSYAFTRVPSTVHEMQRYVRAALEERERNEAVPFVVRDCDTGRVLGTTRYLDLAFWRVDGPSTDVPSVVEIGSTWYAASAQRTRVNTGAKWLLLTHAFETWSVYRTSFQTDARNRRSCAAILRLGAQPEGVRRAHKQASDGSVRDTAYFSILADEWPLVRTRLRERLYRR